MGWVQTLSTEELVCVEERTKAVSTRIESRKTEEGWVIYKSFYNETGLNYTQEYLAATSEKMSQIVQTLQKEKRPTLAQLREMMLQKSKRVSVNVERAFKEYNVEKWKFSVNGEGFTNFALVRCYDEIDVDVVLHDSYKEMEQSITNELLAILGFDGMDDVLNINFFYFQKTESKHFDSQNEEPIEFL